MKNGRVILFTSSRVDVTRNDVIVIESNSVLPYPLRNNPVKFHHDRIRFSRVIVFTSSGGAFIGYDVTDDVIITKINRVLPYLTRNNPVKFHHDRIRFS